MGQAKRDGKHEYSLHLAGRHYACTLDGTAMERKSEDGSAQPIRRHVLADPDAISAQWETMSRYPPTHSTTRISLDLPTCSGRP